VPAVASLLVLAACGLDARPVGQRYGLQPSTRASLADQPDALARIEVGLEARFGTPDAPAYPRTEEWKASGFDPAHPERPADAGGSGELSAELLARVRAGNARRFADDLAAIAAGELDDVDEPRGQPALFAAFRSAALDSAAPPAARAERARTLFEDFYPSLAESAELYRIECLHCHGVGGGGDGPTASFIAPRPRDFRRGIFKWTSVRDAARPTRADLVHVIEAGVYGTSMPSFRRLSEAERQGLADYVRFLAVRGEVERQVVLAVEDEEELSDATFDEAFELVWEKWERAREKVVAWDGAVPEPTPAAIALGERLFHDAKKGNCAACHGDTGRGDGPVAFKLDDRGKRVPAYQDAWGFDILPRDLAREPFRGGRRPIDLFRRVHAGINGGPMPAMSGLMTDEEIWAVVHYTRTLARGAYGGDEGAGAPGPAGK
jgi:mono/diheme cytochrome c family protein